MHQLGVQPVMRKSQGPAYGALYFMVILSVCVKREGLFLHAIDAGRK